MRWRRTKGGSARPSSVPLVVDGRHRLCVRSCVRGKTDGTEQRSPFFAVCPRECSAECRRSAGTDLLFTL